MSLYCLANTGGDGFPRDVGSRIFLVCLEKMDAVLLRRQCERDERPDLVTVLGQ